MRHGWLLFLLAFGCAGDRSAPGGDDDAGRDGGPLRDAGPGIDAGPVPLPTEIERYLRSDAASRLVLEVDYVSGQEPPSAVSGAVSTELEGVLDKPGGVEVRLDGTIPSRGADYAWTDDELRTLAAETRSFAETDADAAMHVLFVDGHSARDGDGSVILGLAFDYVNMVIFRASIERACASATIGPLLRDELCAAALRNVWIHEVGHVIGLVNRGLPMQTDHQDEAHGAHDDDPDCVMYWAAETGQLVTALADRLLGGGSADMTFGPECLADIAAVRDSP